VALQLSIDPVLLAIVQSRQNYSLSTAHLSHALPSQFEGFQPVFGCCQWAWQISSAADMKMN